MNKIILIAAGILLTITAYSQSEIIISGKDIYVATQIVPATENDYSFDIAIWKAASITAKAIPPRADWTIDVRDERITYWIEVEYVSNEDRYEVYIEQELKLKSLDFSSVKKYISKEIYRIYTGEKK